MFSVLQRTFQKDKNATSVVQQSLKIQTSCPYLADNVKLPPIFIKMQSKATQIPISLISSQKVTFKFLDNLAWLNCGQMKFLMNRRYLDHL